jgi:hypothetical protein
MLLNKEFSNKNASKSWIIGIIFVIGGIAFMMINFLIGLGVIALGAILFFLIKNLASNYTVTLRDDGFTVRKVNKKKGTTVQDYLWSDVTETVYYEKDSGDYTYYYFKVKTANNIAFDLIEMKGFDDLILIVNEKTPHLPYQWVKPKGILKSRYEKQMRG